MAKSPRWLDCHGAPALSAAYSNTLTRLAIYRGIALSMRRATPSSSTTGTALTWSGFAGPNRNGEIDLPANDGDRMLASSVTTIWLAIKAECRRRRGRSPISRRLRLHPREPTRVHSLSRSVQSTAPDRRAARKFKPLVLGQNQTNADLRAEGAGVASWGMGLINGDQRTLQGRKSVPLDPPSRFLRRDDR